MAAKEIGGYFELEHFHGLMLHEDALALSCGRACIEYLLRQKKIKKVLLPYFICDVVPESCAAAGAEVRYYHINSDFLPCDVDIQEDEWLYVVNFYGQLGRADLEALVSTFSRVIVDNSHAYFDNPLKGVDTLYTCRKFFGVPDGGFLYTDAPECDLPKDISYGRMNFVLGRFEKSAGEFYAEASDNNDFFSGQPVKRMSALTENILRAVDYEHVKSTRSRNFLQLHEALKDINLLSVRPVEGAYAYPLLIKDGMEKKKELIAEKIFVPTLWPNVLKYARENSLEYNFSANILPLPCDQRYGEAEMDRIISFFK